MFSLKNISKLNSVLFHQNYRYSTFLDRLKQVENSIKPSNTELASKATQAQLDPNSSPKLKTKKTASSNIPLVLATKKTLQEFSNVSQNKDEPLKPISNRKLLKALEADPKILELLDREDLGSEKQTRYSRPLGKPIKRSPLKLKSFKFAAGAKSSASFPPETIPEVAFIGRSNVGKSSLLNLISNSVIARVSDKPGATQQLNFFNSGLDFIIVDMPGYGFAHTSEDKRDAWLKMIDEYIDTRKTLKRIMILLDARH
ncbi:hypothetical protein BB561_007019, partial [Smittium simulii]